MNVAAAHWRLAVGALLAAVLGLQGCGSGDAGGLSALSSAGQESSSDGPRNSTYYNRKGLNAANAQLASATVMSLAEGALAFASVVFDADLGSPAAFQGLVTRSCPNGGSAEYRLEDNDQSGARSAGDRMIMSWRECHVPLTHSIHRGTLVVTFQASTEAGLQNALVRFEPGFSQARNAAFARVDFSGSLVIQAGGDSLNQIARIRPAPANDLAALSFRRGTGHVERVLDPQFDKHIRFDKALIETSLSARIDSTSLGLPIELETPEPLVSYLDTFPHLGRLQLKDSEGGQLAIHSSATDQNESARLKFTLAGAEIPDSSEVWPWIVTCDGYLWHAFGSPNEGIPLPPVNLTPGGLGVPTALPRFYFTRLYRPNDFRISATSNNQTLPVWGPFKIQFNRPLAATNHPRFKFVPWGSNDRPDPVAPEVPAVVTIQGALLTLVPAQQLVHGKRYVVSISIDGQLLMVLSGTFGLPFHDERYNYLVFAGGSFTTRANLSAVITAPATRVLTSTLPVSLSAERSSSTGAAIAGYRWRQISGTPLMFDNPLERTTPVRLAASFATQAEIVAIELEIADTAGETSAARVEIHVLPPAAEQFVAVIQGDAGNYLANGKSYLVTPATGPIALRLSADRGRLDIEQSNGERWQITVAAPMGSTLQPGAYPNASSTLNTADPSLSVTGDGRGCGGNNGRFDVHEFEVDGAGIVVRAAFDIELYCSGQEAALWGSVRFNSNRPVR